MRTTLRSYSFPILAKHHPHFSGFHFDAKNRAISY
jgi:hypothetical protein